MEDYIGQETIVNIFEVNKDHYKYTTKQEDNDMIFESSLYFAK